MMKKPIKKLAVIGAGVMGTGIAALIANASYQVVLLDIVIPNEVDRNSLLRKSLEKITTGKLPALAHPNKLKLITIGNLEDDLELLQTCDLVIEVIIEDIDLKCNLYNKISPYLAPQCILASNTSTLTLKLLKQNLPQELRKRFVITHFFNPPRYMDLVELITDEYNSSGIIEAVTDFIEQSLGKTIVKCNDTPGFIANRLGCFLLELVVRKCIKLQLNPAIIDYYFTNLLKLPKTGIFGLYDLIGHDVMYLISNSLLKELPANDAYHQIYINIPLLNKMREQNLIGRKADSGFYKLDQNKIKQIISLNPQGQITYEPLVVEQEFTDIKSLLVGNDPYNLFFQEVLCKFYKYLFNLLPSVTNNIENIDMAIRLGYNWQLGPYELLVNHIGLDWLKSQNVKIPDNLPINFSTNKAANFEQDSKIIFSNNCAVLFLHQDYFIFSIKTKMNILNKEVFALLTKAVDYAESLERDLIIYSQEANFSAGADLNFIKNNIRTKNYNTINSFLMQGQDAMQRLKYTKINIISCAKGAALGGGAEILLHSDFIIAQQDLNAGFVEVSVNFAPSFGGMKEMFLKADGNKKKLLKNILNILQSNKSHSAEYFIQDYDIASAKIIMNKDYLLAEALELGLPPKIYKNSNQNIKIQYVNLKDELDNAGFNETQIYLLNKFQKIIDCKSITENELLKFERECFIHLCKTATVLPINH